MICVAGRRVLWLRDLRDELVEPSSDPHSATLHVRQLDSRIIGRGLQEAKEAEHWMNLLRKSDRVCLEWLTSENCSAHTGITHWRQDTNPDGQPWSLRADKRLETQRIAPRIPRNRGSVCPLCVFRLKKPL